ncbi:MAG: SUMF1/EgtB/PvdO family nonheme iron enzyme, partial [Bryobacterales bacterium]|nr:SUMF1/EgtB/PvdO family nonheme iron enzyme [Bryobacterales bacterium]
TRPQSYTGKAVLHGFEHRHIAPLEREGIRTFLEKWSGALYPGNEAGARKHCKELVGALASRREIRLMARTPVMLTALAVVHWNERRIPEQRAELYESIINWLLRSREERPGRETVDRSRRLLQDLALAMQSHAEGRQVQVSRPWAAKLLERHFGDIEKAERYLEDEEGDSGVIVSRGHEVRFAHLTFQEYLAARAINGMGEAAQYKLLLEGDRIYKPEWREVATLLAGVFHGQGPAKVDGLIGALLDGLGPKPTLAVQAQCAGLVGAIVRDLRPLGYSPTDPRYQQTLDAVLGIFDKDKAASVEFRMRLEAAEALGQAGDPRLRTPGDEGYWVSIPGEPFQIGRYPVTVDEFRKFLDDDGYQDARWWVEGGFGKFQEPNEWDEQQGHGNRPVGGVSWFEAAAYCAWAGVRLATEREWERAARGAEGREYPWGDEKPDETRASYGMRVGHPTPVGLYPKGATPAGAQDMVGNVWEWVADWFDEKKTLWLLRGGSFGPKVNLQFAIRFDLAPENRNVDNGFRCARDAESP